MGEALDAGPAAFIAVISVLIVYSVLSNVGVIVVVVRRTKLRTVTNILLANLAMSDILLAGAVLPQHVHDITHAEDFFESAAQCKVVNWMPMFCITASIYTLMAMAQERYRTVVVKATTKWTPAFAVKLAGGIWVLAGAVSGPLLWEYAKVDVLDVQHNTDHETDHDTDHDNVNGTHNSTLVGGAVCSHHHIDYSARLVYGLFLLLACYCVPQVVIYTKYSQLIYFVRKHSRHAVAANVQNTSQVAKNRSKVTKMVILCSVLFSASWLPYFCLFTVERVTGTADSTEGDAITRILQISFATFSTCYNGVVYLCLNVAFRREVLALFGCRPATVEPAHSGSTRRTNPKSAATGGGGGPTGGATGQ